MTNARQFMAERTAAWTKSGAPQPYDYKAQWLQALSNEWVDTKVSGSMTVDLIVKMPSTARCIMGFDLTRDYFNSYNNHWTVWTAASEVGSPVTDWQNLRYVRVKTNNVFTSSIEDSSGNVANTSGGASSNTLSLFSSRGSYGNGAMIQRCKIKDENGVLVRDFVPVAKDGLGYLFDFVSGEPFGNGIDNEGFPYASIGPRLDA